jgi:hypothetical protein
MAAMADSDAGRLLMMLLQPGFCADRQSKYSAAAISWLAETKLRIWAMKAGCPPEA